MNSKQLFNERISSQYLDSEISRIIEANPDCTFYEICQSFLDIALNAPRIKNDDGTLGGIFLFTDIEIAQEKTISFIKDNKIKDIDSFFNILESMYPHSADPTDNRQKCGFIQESNTQLPFGYFGTLYFFTEISDDIFEKIVNKIKSQIN